MPLVCVVTLEMARPGTSKDTVSRWKSQREHGDSLYPDPYWQTRTWKGSPEAKDWFLLEALLQREGWHVIRHSRDFVEKHGGERRDAVEFGSTMPRE